MHRPSSTSFLRVATRPESCNFTKENANILPPHRESLSKLRTDRFYVYCRVKKSFAPGFGVKPKRPPNYTVTAISAFH